MHQVKAHDVMAFTASKAFQSGLSLEQILAAFHWKSHNIFTQFDLKDVTWADSELCYLGSVVVAQSADLPVAHIIEEICMYVNSFYIYVYKQKS